MMLMKKPLSLIMGVFVAAGLVTFVAGLFGQHPERAWQAYLINFLLWSAVAQGGLLFSAVMHTTKARWSGQLSRISESFAAFFPVSFLLFLVLLFGRDQLFPWLHQDLHGKEAWLNIPFLFSRNIFALIVLYGLGFAYLYYVLGARLHQAPPQGKIRKILHRWWTKQEWSETRCRQRLGLFSILYILSFVLTLSLLGYDLIMSMDPHWYSTLFGAYNFIKAVYMGLGGLIILAFVLYVKQGADSGLTRAHFYDIGKLFFAFCLMWADFFYVQLVVIWYGNIPEETAYVIERTMMAPWNRLAWFVFVITFVIPFFVLLNKKIKAMPKVMIPLCALSMAGIWLEHLLLLGPVLNHQTEVLPLGIGDGVITLGFLGLMVFSIAYFIELFPEIFRTAKAG
jgi:hypothetical protein